MSKFFWSALLLIGLMGPAAAGPPPVTVPAPDIGGGLIGMLLAASAIYLSKRRGR